MPLQWVGAWPNSLSRVVMPVLILIVSAMSAFGQAGPTGNKASSDNPKMDSAASVADTRIAASLAISCQRHRDVTAS